MLCSRQPLLVVGISLMTLVSTSLIIASCDPKKLASFYSFAVDGELYKGSRPNHYSILSANGIRLEVYKPSITRDFTTLGRRSALCLTRELVDDPIIFMSHWISGHVKYGGKIVEGPVLEAFGAETWMEDPEGNSYLLLALYKTSSSF